MANERDKEKHGKRFLGDEHAIRKQLKIAKAYGVKVEENDRHKFHKKHALNCGDPKCHMCGNPRKFFKEKTMQEKRFEQVKLHEDAD